MSKRETLNIGSVEDLMNKNDDMIRSIRHINDHMKQETGLQRKAIIKTYGCQMNEHDSEKLEAMLMEMGYLMTSELNDADLVIFNTCCVRENAELKVFGNLGRIKKLKETKPDLILAVCGCMMQQPHIVEEIKKKYRYVDLVFGTHNLINFPTLLEETLKKEAQVVEVWDTEGDVIEGIQSIRKKDLKAYVNIMYGCDNFCAYCIVPYTRGRERSRKPHDIVDEVTTLVENGTKEIMILGQNVNSYGKHLEESIDFADLLVMLNDVKGIERIRFMTSHPKDITQKLLETMAACDKVCEYLHLPVQSGSNHILKQMNRRYTREQYLDIVTRARALMPNIGITTDIIVGFPGESEDDFQETLDIVNQVRYDAAFTYLYSKRTGTPAATHESQVPEDVKHHRFDRLLQVLNPLSEERMASQNGKVVEVLVEDFGKHDKRKLFGRTRENLTVNFMGSGDLIGKRVLVRVTKPKQFSLFGEWVETL